MHLCACLGVISVRVEQFFAHQVIQDACRILVGVGDEAENTVEQMVRAATDLRPNG